MALPYCTCRHKAYGFSYFFVLKMYACTYPKIFELSNNLAMKEKKIKLSILITKTAGLPQSDFNKNKNKINMFTTFRTRTLNLRLTT